MASIWVTGAPGFIGQHLVRHLASEGASVAGLGGDPDWGGQGDCAAFAGGRIDRDSIAAIAARTGLPQAIYHLAGGASVGASLASPRNDFDRTLPATMDLLEWLRQEAPGTPLVMVSSAAVYGAGHDGPIATDAPTRPFSPYGHHKLAAELLCRSHAQSFGLPVAIVRLFSVYGPGLRKQLLWDLCGKLDRDGAALLGGTGDELRDWTDVRDVVRILPRAMALASAHAPVFNGGTGRGTAVRVIAGLAAQAFGVAADGIRFTGQSRAGDPRDLVARPEPVLGDGPFVAPERGVADFVAWYRGERQA